MPKILHLQRTKRGVDENFGADDVAISRMRTRGYLSFLVLLLPIYLLSEKFHGLPKKILVLVFVLLLY